MITMCVHVLPAANRYPYSTARTSVSFGWVWSGHRYATRLMGSQRALGFTGRPGGLLYLRVASLALRDAITVQGWERLFLAAEYVAQRGGGVRSRGLGQSDLDLRPQAVTASSLMIQS